MLRASFTLDAGVDLSLSLPPFHVWVERDFSLALLRTSRL